MAARGASGVMIPSIERRVRPFDGDDLPRIASLMRAAHTLDPRIDAPDEAALAAFLALESNRGGRDFALAEAVVGGAARLEAVLLSGRFAVVDRARPVRGFRVVVAPEAHHAGWADRLLDLVDAQDPPGAVVQRTVIGDDRADARARLEARGFAHTRTVVHMRRAGLPPGRPSIPTGHTLRDADPHLDGPSLSGLYNAAHREAFGFAPISPAELLDTAGAPGGRMLALDGPDGRLVGAVQTLPYYAGVGVLHAVQVAPEAQGRGLGRLLVAAALNALAQHGFGIVELAVDADNGPARALYAGLGFSDRGRDLVYERRR